MSKNPSPETWGPIAKGGGIDPTDNKRLTKLYGPVLNAKVSNLSMGPVYAEGIAALSDLRQILIQRYVSKEMAEGYLPTLYNSQLIRQRAALVRSPKDGTLVPVAHIGPNGYELLDERSALLSMISRKDQDAAIPPGGFAPEGWAGFGARINRAAETVDANLKKPPVRAAMGLAGVVFTVVNLLKLVRGS